MIGKYKPYPEYKDSEIEWLGDVPAHWEICRVKNVATINPSKSEVRGLPVDSQVSFIPMDAIGEKGELDASRVKTLPEVLAGYTYVADGDIMIAKITPCFENGKGAIAKNLINGIGFATTEVIPIRPERPADADFLFYALNCNPFKFIAESSMYGAGGQKRVADSFVAEYHLSFPPESERVQIGNFIDHETTRIDNLIEKQQQFIQLLKEKRQAVISHAVTKGFNSKVKMQDSGIEWLGDVPAHWALSQPRYVCSFVGGGTPTKENSAFWDGDIPWVSPKDMKQDYISNAQDNITPAALSQSAVKLIGAGTVLIVVRGMILDHSVPVALSEAELTINQDMKALIPNAKLDGEYLLYCLKGMRDNILDLVESSAHGTKCLRTEQFDRMVLPLPPLSEQLNIIAQLKDALGRLDKLILNTELMIELAIERRSALISAAITGKINVREWAAPKTNQTNKEVAA